MAEDAASVIPRRHDIDRFIPAEKAIRHAVHAVEEAGMDPLLTDAVVLLGQAQERVAQWEDRRRLANLTKAIWGPEEE